MEHLSFKAINRNEITNQKKWQRLLNQELLDFQYKIIVLDDDPTGTQTVHEVSVYTEWSISAIKEGFAEESPMFYILTNSRALTAKETSQLHQEIALNIILAAGEQPYLIISRGDSTLRGHYPLETQILKETFEKYTDIIFDGEILYPFFAEGNRVTVNDTHYLKQGDDLVPVGDSEFAKDRTFGYDSSNLKEWIQEKTVAEVDIRDISSLELEQIRQGNLEQLVIPLLITSDFSKVVVNSLNNVDLIIATIAIIRSIKAGKKFIFRTAAAFPRALSGMEMAPLLTKDQLIDKNNSNGGLVIVGSHVKKSTQQLIALQTVSGLISLEMNTDLVVDDLLMKKEVERVLEKVEKNLKKGQTVVVYTKRKRLDLGANLAEEELALSVKISKAVTDIVSKLNVQPAFIIAKGGITSSQIATEGLKIKKAYVLGQIKPGIPVWQMDEKSKFPKMSYTIFPGNVGNEDDLKEIVKMLTTI